jgi:hypothetical protein
LLESDRSQTRHSRSPKPHLKISDRLYNSKTQQAIAIKQQTPDRLKHHLKISDRLHNHKIQQAIAIKQDIPDRLKHHLKIPDSSQMKKAIATKSKKTSIAYSLIESDRYQTTNSRSPKTSSQNLPSLSNQKEIAPKSKKILIAYSFLESDRYQSDIPDRLKHHLKICDRPQMKKGSLLNLKKHRSPTHC